MTEASAPLSHRNRWGIPANGGPIDLRRAAVPRPAVLSASPRDVVLDLARTALVLVDLQNDFCAAQGWLASIGVDVAVLTDAVSLSDRLAAAARYRMSGFWDTELDSVLRNLRVDTLRAGDVLILPPGSVHRIVNTSPAERLYTVTVTIMANDPG
jgi:hypothetical protein